MTHSLSIIDDDGALCDLLRDYLQAAGFDVAALHNGADATDYLRSAEAINLVPASSVTSRRFHAPI